MREQLERIVRAAQAEGRIPAVQVALVRADRPGWTFEVGGSGTDRPLDAGTRFRIGSITKTFTAVLAMQARDDGLLDLDDAIGAHLDVPAHGDLTIRRLLGHRSGLQREPYGDIWDSRDSLDVPGLLAQLDKAERVLPPRRRLHYSNLGIALVGQAVARLRGGTWEDVLAEKILRPLGLSTVTVQPTAEAAVGYLVDAYSDHARPEPMLDCRGIAPAAQLWGTAADLARWAAFLADPATVDPRGRVLAASSVDEMRWPATATDEDAWAAGFGLGLILVPQGNRVVHVGHDGAMPGFLAAAYGRRGSGTPPGLGVAALGSAGNGAAVIDLPHQILAKAVDLDPADVPVWVPGEPAPEAYRSILGRWWGEGYEYVFRWRDGHLEARAATAPADRPPAVFAVESADALRVVSGREAGERLRLTRDESGRVARMHWATYRFTREQETFDGVPAYQP